MKTLSSLALAAVAGLLLTAAPLTAADKTYQVTGPVLEVTPEYIVVQKGTDKWQVLRDKGTKINGDIKVGSRVTIYYTMTATEVEVKDAKAKK
jgi:hypothetical protein